jgi:hypothetical protein
VSFNELETDDITFLLDAGIVRADEGKVVKISANGTVALCNAEDIFYGKLVKIDTAPDAGAVRGCDCCVEVAYTGAPALNWQPLVANGAGGVKPPAAAVAATHVTGVVANNNAILFTAKKAGVDGNNISVQLKDPAAFSSALSVDVVGRDIIVSLATGVDPGNITSTAALVIAAIAASSAADLVTAVNSGASTGAAAVVAVALTDLSGGTDAGVGRPMFVLTKDTGAGTLVMCCP